MTSPLGTVLLAAGTALTLSGPLRSWLAHHTPSSREAGEQLRRVARLCAPAVALGLIGAVGAWWISQLPVLFLLGAAAGGYLPFAVQRSRAARLGRERERAWPAALSQLADGLEGGLAFPAAAAFVAQSGPTVLRPVFARFYQAIRDGRLNHGLDELAREPERAAATAATLIRAAFVDTPTGRAAPTLRELTAVLRERFETREKARNRAVSLHREAAILAVSPLAFLLLIGATAPGYLNAYRTLAGTLVSTAGAIVIAGCYLAMLRLGRIPDPAGTDQ